MFLIDMIKRKKPPVDERDMSRYTYVGSGYTSINETILLQNPTAIACIDLISKSISLLPLNLYNKGSKGRVKAEWHPLHQILRHLPNGEEPSSLFIEKVVRDVLKYGNAYIWKSKSENKLDALYSLNAKHVSIYRDSVTNEKRFEYNGKVYTSKDILHIPGADYDGTKGYSPAVYGAKAIQMGVNLDDYASSSFDNGPNSSLSVDISEMYPNGAKPEDVKSMADYIQRNYAGKTNAGKPFVAFNKMKVSPIQVSSNRDAELQAAREYQEKVIMKVFNVPASMLGDSESGYGDLEARMIAFLQFTLGPWIRRLEQFFEMLLTPSERINYYVEFDPSVLLKTSLTEKTNAYANMIRSGILSINEVRQRENLDALPDKTAGDAHFMLSNMMPVNKETIDSYMASQKIKLKEAGEKTEPKVDKKIL